MSVVAATVPRVIHPWHRLRDLADWTLRWHHPDDDSRMGVTRHSVKEISLRLDLTWEERRCTILHECLHAEHGPVLVAHSRQHERNIRRATARLMLPSIRAIGDAFAWALSEGEAAEELGVDVGVLRDRLRSLHPSELHYLRARLGDSC